MRATDDRYRGEQAKFDLAMRMIEHEARTGTIRYFTGMNDDRIRKLYTSYFKYGEAPVRRQRGRSPTRIGPLVRTPQRALESGVFANLLLANGLISRRAPAGPAAQAQRRSSAIGSASASRRSICSCRAARCRSSGAGTCWSACAAATSSASLAATRARSATCSTSCRCRARRARPACCSSSATPSSRSPRPGSIAGCASSSSAVGAAPGYPLDRRRQPRRAARAAGARAPHGGRSGRACSAGAISEPGGTWLAVDRRGRFAAVTNIRDPRAAARARGRAARSSRTFSRAADSAARYAARAVRDGADFGAFNLLLYDGRELTSRATARPRRGSATGLHAFSNAPPGVGVAEDRERARGSRAVAGACARPIEPSVRPARRARRLGLPTSSASSARTSSSARFTARVARRSCSSTRGADDVRRAHVRRGRTHSSARCARASSSIVEPSLDVAGNAASQRADRADLFDADRVRHRIDVPLDLVAERLERAARGFAEPRAATPSPPCRAP